MAVLNLPRLESPRFTCLNPATGRPVAHGWVRFFGAGTTTLKEVYANREGTAVAQNPMRLDAAGSCEVFLSGPYRIEVTDAQGGVVYSADQLNSITFETEAGNPGALIANNNLSDLTDFAAARDALGLARQNTPLDAVADRILSVGSFGLGAGAVEITGNGALNSTSLPTGFLFINQANSTIVGGPGLSGVCLNIRGQNGNISQTYFPTADGSVAPFRRRYANSAWSPWVRDAAIYRESGRTAEVRQSGMMTQWAATGGPGAGFVYANADALSYTWTFQRPFAQFPHISMMLPQSGEPNFVNVNAVNLGALQAYPLVTPGQHTQAQLVIRRSFGAPNFAAGMQVNNVPLRAEGLAP